jgi:hypothetical protein
MFGTRYFGRRCLVENYQMGIESEGFWHGFEENVSEVEDVNGSPLDIVVRYHWVEVQDSKDLNKQDWYLLKLETEYTKITFLDREDDGTPILEIEEEEDDQDSHMSIKIGQN